MLKVIRRRLLIAIPTMLVLIALSFFLMKLAPGGPFDTERALSEQEIENLNKYWGLDKPLYEQFGLYLWRLPQGDLGYSTSKDKPVGELIAQAAPVSFTVGVLSLILAGIVGCTIGVTAAFWQNRFLDHQLMSFAMTGMSVPTFVMGPILLLVYGVWLMWVEVGGWQGLDFSALILPVITLALPQIAYLARITRGSMIETLRSPFVRTARAKGLPTRVILRRHLLKPAALPVISFLGPATAGVITGSVVIEKVFALPGLGRFFVDAALNRDLELAMGVVILYGALIIVANLVVDLMYVWLDPRQRVPT